MIMFTKGRAVDSIFQYQQHKNNLNNNADYGVGVLEYNFTNRELTQEDLEKYYFDSNGNPLILGVEYGVISFGIDCDKLNINNLYYVVRGYVTTDDYDLVVFIEKKNGYVRIGYHDYEQVNVYTCYPKNSNAEFIWFEKRG